MGLPRTVPSPQRPWQCGPESLVQGQTRRPCWTGPMCLPAFTRRPEQASEPPKHGQPFCPYLERSHRFLGSHYHESTPSSSSALKLSTGKGGGGAAMAG
ncbi:hypothetical protein E2C01_088277 [Portunus trituberculatus]|uniref:Uncharacterized protein n=1 Tax=Portunus trituberculatus TaxID=210409 RepID=A0A5B7JEY5_PORTR|nr:hypothetical protein [Portunus trituberculatus]